MAKPVLSVVRGVLRPGPTEDEIRAVCIALANDAVPAEGSEGWALGREEWAKAACFFYRSAAIAAITALEHEGWRRDAHLRILRQANRQVESA